MKRALIICWAALVAAVICPAAPVQPEVRKLMVQDRGPGTVDQGYVLAHVRTRVGMALDRNVISKDVRALLDTGRFTDVTVEVVPAGAEVDVVYSVVGRWRLTARPTFEGASHFRLSRMHDWLDLAAGDLIDDPVVGARTRDILDEYREDHYASASISWEIIPVDEAAGLARLELVVDEGRKTKVRNFRIEGNRAVGTRELLNAVRFPKWWNPFRVFRSLDAGGEDFLVYRAALRDVYLDRGYLDAEVSEPRVVEDARGRPVISVSITEGRQYLLGALSATGILLFPEAEVTAGMSRNSGRVASMSRIQAQGRAIRDYYGRRGYIQTLVRPALNSDPARGVVDVVYQVREGRLAYIRNIRISGNGRTRDKVIRRELTVYPGDKYDEVSVARSQRRLQNLGFFSRVNAFPVDTPYEDQKDLHLEVEEKPTGQFMVGAGFSSIDRAMGFVELSQGNFDIKGWPYFTGGGQKLKLRSEFGSTRSQFDISFVEPWFLDRKLSLSLDLYRSEVDYSAYDVRRTGFSVGVAKPLPWNNRVELRYRLEESLISDVEDTNEYSVVDTGESYYFNWEEDKIDSSLTLGLLHDTRDSSYLPKTGARVRLAYTVTGGPLGFDSDLYKLTFKARRYFNPWWNHVLSFRGRYEVIEAYGDTDEVGLSDRLFLGGGRNLRGFDYRDVGPKAVPVDDEDTTSYRALGGQSMAFASVAYTMPIVRNVRFAMFYDTGNVWADAYEFDPGDLASSAGFGIRLDMPGFPIRIDRAWVLDSDDDLTEDDPWSFWIGHDF